MGLFVTLVLGIILVILLLDNAQDVQANTYGREMKNAGPYEIANEHLYPCDDQGTREFLMYAQMYRKQGSDSYLHRGNITVPENMENFELDVKIYKWTTGWLLAHTFKGEFCKTANEIVTDIFGALCDQLGAERFCPIPEGFYEFNDWEVNELGFPATELEYGKYKGEVGIVLNHRVIGCLMMEAEVKEKEEE